MNVKFECLEVGGIIPALKGMRLPTKSMGDTVDSVIGEKDIRLAKNLIKKGNTHAKFQRGIIAWFEIEMPRSIWSELDTYTVGYSPISSESTMYTLIKECADITPEMFVDYTPNIVIRNFWQTVHDLSDVFGGRKHIPIHILKSALPEGWLQKRVRAYSYQALKGMYFSRKGHRMPEWEVICNQIEQLPHFEDFLIGCPKDEFICELKGI